MSTVEQNGLSKEENNNTAAKPAIAGILETLWSNIDNLKTNDPDRIPEDLKHVGNKDDLVAALYHAAEESTPQVKTFVEECGLQWDVVSENILSQTIILQVWQ